MPEFACTIRASNRDVSLRELWIEPRGDGGFLHPGDVQEVLMTGPAESTLDLEVTSSGVKIWSNRDEILG